MKVEGAPSKFQIVVKYLLFLTYIVGLGCLTDCPSVRTSTVRRSGRPTVWPSDRPSLCPSVRPSVRQSVRSTVQPSLRPTGRPIARSCVQPSMISPPWFAIYDCSSMNGAQWLYLLLHDSSSCYPRLLLHGCCSMIIPEFSLRDFSSMIFHKLLFFKKSPPSAWLEQDIAKYIFGKPIQTKQKKSPSTAVGKSVWQTLNI